MAFNLNKGDESSNNLDSSNKSNSKFDLSKSEASSTTMLDPPPKSQFWIFALLGLLLIVGGAWYFMSNTKTGVGPSDESKIEPSIALSADSQKSLSVSEANSIASSSQLVDTTKSNLVPSIEVATGTDNNSSGNNQSDVSKINTSEKSERSSILNNKVTATFEVGSASLSNVDQSFVNEVIIFLQNNPKSSVNINGYASSEGELNVNQRLSQSRADALKRYLVSKGITKTKIVAIGKGTENPITTNDTEEGRQKNRRVEISLQ